MTSPENIPTPSIPQVRTSTLLIILGALSAFAPLATDMYLSSFPLLADYFHTNAGLVSISLSVYFLGVAVGQLFYGPLIDRFGRKPLLQLGILIFSIASLLLTIAPSIHSFIVIRFLQSIGGCAGMVVARAVISDLYDERESARVFSLMMIIIVIAPIIAPILGGYLISLAGWKSIFVFLASFGTICLILSRSFLPETLHRDNRRLVTVTGILKTYALLLVKRQFILPTLICAISYGELFTFISGSPFVYMNLYGISAEHYGLIFGINAIGMICAAKVNHTLLAFTSPRKILWGCVGWNLVFSVILVFFAAKASLPFLVLLLLLALVCIPAIGANTVALAMAASTERRGSSSAMIGVLQFGIASLASGCVGFFHNGTVYPMVCLILVCSLIATSLLLLDSHLSRQRPVPVNDTMSQVKS